MTETIIDPTVDSALKAKHRAMWASGNYPNIATELIADLGPTIVSALDITAPQAIAFSTSRQAPETPRCLPPRPEPASWHPTSPPNCWRWAGATPTSVG